MMMMLNDMGFRSFFSLTYVGKVRFHQFYVFHVFVQFSSHARYVRAHI